MDTEENVEAVKIPEAPSNDRILAFLEIFFCSGLVSSLVATLPLSLLGDSISDASQKTKVIFASYLLESVVLLGLIAFFQRIRKQTIRDLGFDSRPLTREVIIGFLLVPILFLVGVVIALYFKHHLPKYFMDKNPLLELINTRFDLVLFVIMVIIAGFKEELQRAFILVRFEKYLFGAPLGLVVWSIAFGAFHHVQGLQGAVNAAILGLCFGLLFLTRKNLISPIIAHTSYDLIALLGFWFSSHK